MVIHGLIVVCACSCSSVLSTSKTDATTQVSSDAPLGKDQADAPTTLDAFREDLPREGPAPDQAPLPADPAPERFGISIDPANPAGNPTAQQLKLAGVRWVRVEWKSSSGHSLYDPSIAALRAAKLKVLLLLDYASAPGKPASSASSGEWSTYLQTFDSTLDAIAAHYGDGVDAWQIWNEPDLPAQPGYDPGVPAVHYGKMLLAAVTTIHKHSTRPVITGGMASGDPGYLTQATQAAALTADAVAVHPYGQRAPDGWPTTGWGFGEMSALLKAYLAFGKPVWISEIGTNDSSSPTFQADYLENVYTLTKSAFGAKVPVVFWFCWSDGMVPPYGIVDAGGQPKPAYVRYQTLAGSW
jgi:hypothetical protein